MNSALAQRGPDTIRASVMLTDDRVPTGRGKRCHVVGITNVGPAAGDSAPAAHLSRVAIDRRDTNESNDMTAVELTELGQIGDYSPVDK
jgi:hypothetical protein